MCDCKIKLKELTEKHRWCNKRVRYESIILDKPVETTLQIICSKIPEIKIETVVDSVIDQVVKDFIDEIKDEILVQTVDYEEDIVPIDENEEDTVELTDISAEELREQEIEEQRIRDELALIQLTKLTKKKVRSKK